MLSMNNVISSIIYDSDFIVILLISVGGDTNSYLSRVLNMPKQTINNKIEKYIKLGLAEVHDRKYILTPECENMIKDIRVIFNYLVLSHKNCGTCQKKDK